MKILIAHHVESMWEKDLLAFNIDLTDYIERLFEFCEENDIEKIILTRFENHKPEDISLPLLHFNLTVKEYGWGWCQESLEDLEYDELENYIEGGDSSEYVLIESWMWDLKGHDVYLCGFFDGRCIADMEQALNHCEIPFQRLEQFIA